MKRLLGHGIIFAALCSAAPAQEPVNIGDRRELLLDNLLVGRLEGGAQRVFHKPVPREVVFKFDQPWEGNACAFVTVFRDGDRYRMYYRAENAPNTAGSENRAYGPYDCYAESPDGIHWSRPALGLAEFQGSKENNIIPKPTLPEGWLLQALNPFRDENPAAAPDALYKAVAPLFGPGNNPDDWWSGREKSLAILKSPDGIHWSLIQENGVVRNASISSGAISLSWGVRSGTAWMCAAISNGPSLTTSNGPTASPAGLA